MQYLEQKYNLIPQVLYIIHLSKSLNQIDHSPLIFSLIIKFYLLHQKLTRFLGTIQHKLFLSSYSYLKLLLSGRNFQQKKSSQSLLYIYYKREYISSILELGSKYLMWYVFPIISLRILSEISLKNYSIN
jgi:hypothetical protein